IGIHRRGFLSHPLQRRAVTVVERIDVGSEPDETARPRRRDGRTAESKTAEAPDTDYAADIAAASEAAPPDVLDDAAHHLANRVETDRLHPHRTRHRQQRRTKTATGEARHPLGGYRRQSAAVPLSHQSSPQFTAPSPPP